MPKIAICDDDILALDTISEYIEKYKSENSANITTDRFTNSAELISKITAGASYDLIFLDIIMPVLNGIDAAKEIRALNYDTPIVFLTSSREFAVDSYSVDALDYILKPINSESFERAMAKFSRIRKEVSSVSEIIINEKSRLTRIALHTLIYIEARDHYLIYHLSDAEPIKFRQKLTEAWDSVSPYPGFIKTNRSYIVNLDYVSKIEQSFITMTNGDRVSLSRPNHKAVSDSFLRYKLEKGGR